MKRDTILFDLDGTLLDTLDDLAAGVNYCMERYGGPRYTREEVRGMVGSGIAVLIEKSLPCGRDNAYFGDCLRDFSLWYGAHSADKTLPYPGIEELLSELKERGYSMAIVSNKFDAAVKDLNLRFFGELIPVAVGEDEASGIRKKPAPDQISAAIRELGSEPERALCVGDSDVDILTAANAGIPCICVSWGFKTRDFLKEHGAEYIVDNPEELSELILHI